MGCCQDKKQNLRITVIGCNTNKLHDKVYKKDKTLCQKLKILKKNFFFYSSPKKTLILCLKEVKKLIDSDELKMVEIV